MSGRLLRKWKLLGAGGGGSEEPEAGGAPGFVTTLHRTAALATATFTAASIGTAAADRLVVVGITGRRASGTITRTLNSVTIGGVSATIHNSQAAALATASNCALVSAPVPTGTTADIVVTFSGTVDEVAIQVYTVTGLSSMTPHDDNGTTGVVTVATTLDIPADGVAIGVGIATGTIGDSTWTGLTEDADATHGTSVIRSTSASASALASQVGRAIQFANQSGTSGLIAAVSWA